MQLGGMANSLKDLSLRPEIDLQKSAAGAVGISVIPGIGLQSELLTA